LARASGVWSSPPVSVALGFRGVHCWTATAWGHRKVRRDRKLRRPAKRRVEAENPPVFSGPYPKSLPLRGYAQNAGHLALYLPTHATSGCWSGGKPEARREARCRPARCPVFDSWSIPPRRSRACSLGAAEALGAVAIAIAAAAAAQQKTWCGAFSFARRRFPTLEMLSARHEPGPAVIELPSATYQPLHVPGRVHRHHVDRTLFTGTGSNFPARKGRTVFNAGISLESPRPEV